MPIDLSQYNTPLTTTERDALWVWAAKQANDQWAFLHSKYKKALDTSVLEDIPSEAVMRFVAKYGKVWMPDNLRVALLIACLRNTALSVVRRAIIYDGIVRCSVLRPRQHGPVEVDSDAIRHFLDELDPQEAEVLIQILAHDRSATEAALVLQRSISSVHRSKVKLGLAPNPEKNRAPPTLSSSSV